MEDDETARRRLLTELVARRKELKIGQRKMAQRMGTTQSAISELEQGITDPRMSTLQRYARAVGWRLGWLLMDAD